MTKKKFVPPGKRIQPGEKRNKDGSSKLARGRAQAKKLLAAEGMDIMDVAEGLVLLTKALRATPAQMRELMANEEKSSNHQQMTASVISNIIQSGDVKSYLSLLERIFGKPKESVMVSGDSENPLVVAGAEEIEARIAAIRKRRKEVGND